MNEAPCRHSNRLRKRRLVHTHAWQGIQEEACAPAASSERNSRAYAALPFKQWLSPNGQWRVRPMRWEQFATLLSSCHRMPSLPPLSFAAVHDKLPVVVAQLSMHAGMKSWLLLHAFRRRHSLKPASLPHWTLSYTTCSRCAAVQDTLLATFVMTCISPQPHVTGMCRHCVLSHGLRAGYESRMVLGASPRQQWRCRVGVSQPCRRS